MVKHDLTMSRKTSNMLHDIVVSSIMGGYQIMPIEIRNYWDTWLCKLDIHISLVFYFSRSFPLREAKQELDVVL